MGVCCILNQRRTYLCCHFPLLQLIARQERQSLVLNDVAPLPPLQDELGTPALAFVRSLMHLMALDSAVADEVALLRRRCLKLLHVGEFNKEAEFQEPCLSFSLRDVICGFCNDCRWGIDWPLLCLSDVDCCSRCVAVPQVPLQLGYRCVPRLPVDAAHAFARSLTPPARLPCFLRAGNMPTMP